MVRGFVARTRWTRWLAGQPGPLPADPTIAIVGFCDTASGIGIAAWGMARALADRSPRCISISALSHTPRIPSRGDGFPTPLTAAVGGADIALHVYNPDVFLAAVRTFGTRLLTQNRLNVAVAIWETESPPPLWADVFSAYDAVWTHSHFSAHALEKVARRPVAVVPIPVPVQQPRARRREDGHYVFLSMFDRHSCLERKNPRAAIRALRIGCQSLPAGTSLVLRVKCHADTPPDVLEMLRHEAGDAPVEFIATTLDDAGMESLWQDCDCLLSLHRSEGFGLPVAEALSRAIPVIASRQGGILDFTDDSGCMLVSGRPAVRLSERGQYREWSGWLEPDVEVAAKYIVAVIANYPQAVARARRGRELLNDALSPRHVRVQVERISRHARK
jgi:glycosyltransferase involved in cell wall biosynthesis